VVAGTRLSAVAGTRLSAVAGSTPLVVTESSPSMVAGNTPSEVAKVPDSLSLLFGQKNELPEQIQIQPVNDNPPVTELLVPVIAARSGSQGQLQTAEPDKAPPTSSGLHVKIGKGSMRKPASVAGDKVGQGTPEIAMTALGFAFPIPTPVVSVLPTVPMPPAVSGMPVVATGPVGEIDVPKGIDLHRPAQAGQRVVEPSSPGHPALVAPVATLSMGEAAAGKSPIRFEPVSETASAPIRFDVPQVAPPATASPLPLHSGQDQPTLPVDRAVPADQILPALVSALKTVDGTASVTVRLQPPELGQVQIRIDQTTAGTSRINITTERPETLQLLQSDEPRLQQALDQAGVLSTGRTVTFQVVTQEQTVATPSRPDNMSSGSSDSGQGQSGGAWRQNEDAQRNFSDGSAADQRQTRARWFRAGLDITA
jgi:hypothetical protein